MDKTELKRCWAGVDRAAVAKSLGISIVAVHQVAAGLRRVSPMRARDFERATDGKVPRWVLRPDVFDRPMPNKVIK